MLGDVSLKCDDADADADKSLKDMFLHLFSSNYALQNVKVIQTPLMETLYETIESRVGKNNCKHILIVGPPSSGKSTTALWLYQQLKHKNVKVKAVPFSGANEVQIEDNLVVICDCNLVNDLVKTAKLEELRALMHLKVNLSKRGGLLVIAASALLEVLTFDSSAQSSMVRYIITGMEKVSTSGFDDAHAEEFIKKISSDTSVEMVKKLIQDSCKVPGLLRECVLQENNIVVVGEHLKRHLSDMLPYVPEYEYRHTLQLLTSVLHGLPLSSFGLEDVASNLCFVKGNFVVLNGNKPPQLYVSAPRSMLIEIIKTFNQHYKIVLSTDEESALGYLFKGVVTNNLQNIELMIQEIEKPEKITVRLDLQFSFTRIQRGMKFIGNGVLWQTQKYYFGVDFIAIATVLEEDVLLLFQVSTRKTDHKTKCEPLVPSEVHTLATSEDKTSPNIIMYLSIFFC